MKSLLLPPLSLFVLVALGLWLRRRWPVLGGRVTAGAAVMLVALSMPVVAGALMHALQVHPPVDPARLPAGIGAIIVLGGDSQSDALDYGGDTVGTLTLERVRYGAYLHRRTALPLLVTGGVVRPERSPVAHQMQAALSNEFGVPVTWVEDSSRDTYENARNSQRLLRQHGIEKILLVTHAWHMRRAVAAFRGAGLDVTPAPTRFVTRPTPLLGDFLPSAGALQKSSFAIHEWLGIVWYAVLGYTRAAA